MCFLLFIQVVPSHLVIQLDHNSALESVNDMRSSEAVNIVFAHKPA